MDLSRVLALQSKARTYLSKIVGSPSKNLQPRFSKSFVTKAASSPLGLNQARPRDGDDANRPLVDALAISIMALFLCLRTSKHHIGRISTYRPIL